MRLGTLLGGMIGNASEPYAPAEALRCAGDTLAHTLVVNPERYQLVYPVLFSYRHPMEL